jgi:tetratricopeptide (TPR) repeat protein
LALLCALLAGCAAPQSSALRSQPPPLPATAVVPVPFFAQDEYQCGPAALTMALVASGAAADPAALRALVYVPARAGALQPEMLATARRFGRLAVVLPPRLDALLTEVADGRPVVVLQNLALPVLPRWHYAVVRGYDLARGELILHSGLNENLRLALDVFEHTWARSGYWAMVATPPEQPPRTPSIDALVAAAVALERLDPAAARRAYVALTERAPRAYGAWIGAGNTAYAARDFAQAAAAFARATELRPDAADAWNNLAMALLEDGRRADARSAVLRALAIGGLRADRYRETLATIEQREAD